MSSAAVVSRALLTPMRSVLEERTSVRFQLLPVELIVVIPVLSTRVTFAFGRLIVPLMVVLPAWRKKTVAGVPATPKDPGVASEILPLMVISPAVGENWTTAPALPVIVIGPSMFISPVPTT